MSLTLIVSVVAGFLITLLITPKFIHIIKAMGIVGTDIQKPDKPEIPEMSGPILLTGLMGGIFLFIGARVFLYNITTGLIEVLAAISTILIITIIGMFDDLGRLAKEEAPDMFGNKKRVGLKQWQKPLLTLAAAVPLMAIMTGDSVISIPFIGTLNIGIIFPLVVIPIGVVGASNAINMLAGLNGLEAGLGAVLLTALGIFTFINGEIYPAAIALIAAASLLAFLVYNWYPAKIMPGDSLVYCIGATVAVVAIIGNIEKFALICFTPWFIELALKLRGGLKAQNFGMIEPDGTLKSKYDKIYSLTHIPMKLGRFKEWQISGIIIGFEALVCLAAFSLVTSGII